MSTRRSAPDVAFPVPCHIALLHHGAADLRLAALEFMREAVGRSDEALLYFGEPGVGERLLRDLEAHVGRELSADRRAGRIMVGEANPDVDQQLENFIVPFEEFRARGYALVRFIGIVAWNVRNFPPPEDFLWFESKLNEVIADLPVIGLCPYDLARIPARAVAYGALETHPFVMSGGVLRENPRFMPPDRYLRERLLGLPWLEGE